MRALAPFYLLRTTIDCWKCGKPTSVIGLAAAAIEHRGEIYGDPASDPREPVSLHHVYDLPYELLQVVQAYQPRYVKSQSRTTGMAHFQNECHACGTNIGDFYLFSEPDGPFFPLWPEAAARVEVFQLPVLGPQELQAQWAQGGIDLIFQRDRK